MAIAWFICPYKIDPTAPDTRYCAMQDFTSRIVGDNGWWTESEILGNHAIVKVRASVATLRDIAGTRGFQRLPKERLDEALSDLTSTQKQAIAEKLAQLGYTTAEMRTVLGDDVGAKTLRDVLAFAATRRRAPRWDPATQTVMVDGRERPCRSIDAVDAEVR